MVNSPAQPNRQVRVPASFPRKNAKRDTPRRALRGRGGDTRARASSRHARLRASFASRAFDFPVATNATRARPLEHRPADGSSSPVPELDGSGSLSRTGSRARRTDESALPVPSSATGVTLEVCIVRHVASARASRLRRRRARRHDSVRARQPRRDLHLESAGGGRRRAGVGPRAPRPSAARADGHAVRGRAGAEDETRQRPRPDAVGRAARPAQRDTAALPIGRAAGGRTAPSRARARFFGDAAANCGGDGGPTAARPRTC